MNRSVIRSENRVGSSADTMASESDLESARRRRGVDVPNSTASGWEQFTRSTMSMGPLAVLALVPQANSTGWIVHVAPARSSWHGLSIEDGLLALVGLMFILVLMVLTAGDSAD